MPGKKRAEKSRPQLQLVVQNPFSSTNPRLTLRSSLMAPLNYHRIRADKREREDLLRELFQECGLKEEFRTDIRISFQGDSCSGPE